MEVQEIQQGMKTEETHHGNIINTMERKKAEQKEFFLEEKAIRAKCCKYYCVLDSGYDNSHLVKMYMCKN